MDFKVFRGFKSFNYGLKSTSKHYPNIPQARRGVPHHPHPPQGGGWLSELGSIAAARGQQREGEGGMGKRERVREREKEEEVTSMPSSFFILLSFSHAF